MMFIEIHKATVLSFCTTLGEKAALCRLDNGIITPIVLSSPDDDGLTIGDEIRAMGPANGEWVGITAMEG